MRSIVYRSRVDVPWDRCLNPQLIQSVRTTSRVLKAAGIGFFIKLAGLRGISERSVCLPRQEDKRIIRLREGKARQRAASLSGTFKDDPRRADISLTDERSRARDQLRHLGRVVHL